LNTKSQIGLYISTLGSLHSCTILTFNITILGPLVTIASKLNVFSSSKKRKTGERTSTDVPNWLEGVDFYLTTTTHGVKYNMDYGGDSSSQPIQTQESSQLPVQESTEGITQELGQFFEASVQDPFWCTPHAMIAPTQAPIVQQRIMVNTQAWNVDEIIMSGGWFNLNPFTFQPNALNDRNNTFYYRDTTVHNMYNGNFKQKN
jgi:hypothetical protein